MLTPCNFLHGSLSVLPGHFPRPQRWLYTLTLCLLMTRTMNYCPGDLPLVSCSRQQHLVWIVDTFSESPAWLMARRPGCEDFYHNQVLPGNPAPRSCYSALCFLLGMDPLPRESHITRGGGGPFRIQLDLMPVCVLVDLG